jgi:hypothetical protein
MNPGLAPSGRQNAALTSATTMGTSAAQGEPLIKCVLWLNPSAESSYHSWDHEPEWLTSEFRYFRNSCPLSSVAVGVQLLPT